MEISLHRAAQRGDNESLRRLIQNGITNVQTNINEKHIGWTQLHFASICGHNECVKILLKHGANVDEKDNIGHTPLVLASMYSHFKCIKTLIDSGADVNYKDNNGMTAL